MRKQMNEKKNRREQMAIFFLFRESVSMLRISSRLDFDPRFSFNRNKA